MGVTDILPKNINPILANPASSVHRPLIIMRESANRGLTVWGPSRKQILFSPRGLWSWSVSGCRVGDHGPVAIPSQVLGDECLSCCRIRHPCHLTEIERIGRPCTTSPFQNLVQRRRRRTDRMTLQFSGCRCYRTAARSSYIARQCNCRATASASRDAIQLIQHGTQFLIPCCVYLSCCSLD